MGELGFNKIFGALLAVGLVVLGLKEISTIISGGGHHGHHEYESANAWATSNFKGYRIDIPEVSTGGDVVEVIYDLGALLMGADAAKGERSFKGKCASCHTIEEGGANGTGPNLYGIMGDTKQRTDGFGYSGALGNTEGSWSWTNMDSWLKAPSKYARGTNMAFAGLNRDSERADVLAYLASYSPDAPVQPEPLPEVEEEVVEGEAEDIAGEEAATDETVVEADDTAGGIAEDAAEAATDAAVQAEAAAADTIETTVETAVTEATEVVEAADEGSSVGNGLTETVESVVDDATDAAEELVEESTSEP